MAKRPTHGSASSGKSSFKLDPLKFENPLQIGGIRTGTLDCDPLSAASSSRVALFDTGAGLRFTVALDRGGDIIDATFNQFALGFLNQVGIRPPKYAPSSHLDWLWNWPGGLVTTCGPLHIGGPRDDNPYSSNLHGHHHNLPAAITSLVNPDPQQGKYDMALTMVVRDARQFGPVLEVTRTIRCTLGQPDIHITDIVLNRSDAPAPHHWLYHVNLGYPLVSPGSRLIYRGGCEMVWNQGQPFKFDSTDRELAALKTVPDGLPEHAGPGERGLIVRVPADRKGFCTTGLINDDIGLGFELSYPLAALPRLANWQHFGPRGSYVTGIEPFFGSLMGKAKDRFHLDNAVLEPGQSRQYDLTLRVLNDATQLAALRKADGPVTAVK